MILFTIATIAVSSIVQHQITKKRIEANSKLRELREEYTRKRQEHQHELAMKLMREGQQLQFQLQQEMFDAQMKQVKTSFVNELQLMVDEMAYKEWPLKVLPWVIQNQSLGNLLFAGDESGKLPKRDRFAMHCILLPSSCPTFNTHVWLSLESKLEEFCNQYWNSSTGRPVMFYSGSWNRIDPALGSRGIKKPASNDIGMLYDRLNQLPTILIQPDFDLLSKKLKVTVTIWGMPEMEGKLSKPEYPDKFQRDYTSEINYRKDTDAAKESIEDLTPYLESLIGYMADTYFWHASNAAPLLPSLIQKGIVNTDGMLYIRESSIEFYNDMLKQVEEGAKKDEFFSQNIPNLFKGISVLWDEREQMQKLTSLYLQHVNHTTGRSYTNLARMMWDELNISTSKLFLRNSIQNIKNGADRITIECCGVKFDMIKVKSGIFMMGEHDEDRPICKAHIPHDYYIGELRVTELLWDTVLGVESSRPHSNKLRHKDYISWNDCSNVFIPALNNKEEIKKLGIRFRLPTEAEWEYAAKGGHYSEKSPKVKDLVPRYRIDEYGRVIQRNPREIISERELAQKKHDKEPNILGIYGMNDDCWEYCQDWYKDGFYGQYHVNGGLYFPQESLPNDVLHVLRGGRSYSGGDLYRCEGRLYVKPEKIWFHGLRLVFEVFH